MCLFLVFGEDGLFIGDLTKLKKGSAEKLEHITMKKMIANASSSKCDIEVTPNVIILKDQSAYSHNMLLLPYAFYLTSFSH